MTTGRDLRSIANLGSAGPVMVIGGAEDKFRDKVILSRFAKFAGGADGHVVVISTAWWVSYTPRTSTCDGMSKVRRRFFDPVPSR